MSMDWKELVDRLDKRPLSVLLGLSIALTAWALMNWRDEVKEHKQDLRKTYEALEKTNEIQYRLIQLMQDKNETKWKIDTTKN